MCDPPLMWLFKGWNSPIQQLKDKKQENKKAQYEEYMGEIKSVYGSLSKQIGMVSTASQNRRDAAIEFKRKGNKRAALHALRQHKMEEYKLGMMTKSMMSLEKILFTLDIQKMNRETFVPVGKALTKLQKLQKNEDISKDIDATEDIFTEFMEKTSDIEQALKDIQNLSSESFGEDFGIEEDESLLNELEALGEEVRNENTETSSVTTTTTTTVIPSNNIEVKPEGMTMEETSKQEVEVVEEKPQVKEPKNKDPVEEFNETQVRERIDLLA